MFHIYYNPTEKQYKMRETAQTCVYTTLAIFMNFDMAYDYVTRMNHTNNQQSVYSRWAVK